MEISQSEFLAKYNIKEDDYIKTNLDWTELERIYDKHIKDTPVLESYLQSLFSHFSRLSHVHSVRYRVKDAEHLIEKIIRKKMSDSSRNLSYETYFGEIDDLVGIRILHLFKDEWEPIHEYITERWNLKETPTAYYRKGDSKEYLDEYEKKGCDLKEHPYGYRSIHYIITEDILSVRLSCEIQVRTVFEEAWSEIDHKIRYPYDMDNPIFKQYLLIFNRLSGSADEMGTFLITLKEHLARLGYEAKQEQENEKAKSDKIIEELRKEISELKISNKKVNSINEKLDKLGKEVSSNVRINENLNSSYFFNQGLMGQKTKNALSSFTAQRLAGSFVNPTLGYTDRLAGIVSPLTAQKLAGSFVNPTLGYTDRLAGIVSPLTAQRLSSSFVNPTLGYTDRLAGIVSPLTAQRLSSSFVNPTLGYTDRLAGIVSPLTAQRLSSSFVNPTLGYTDKVAGIVSPLTAQRLADSFVNSTLGYTDRVKGIVSPLTTQIITNPIESGKVKDENDSNFKE
ncbi:MAG: hypothetical protein ACLVGC_11020 [Bacteroides uniformis]